MPIDDDFFRKQLNEIIVHLNSDGDLAAEIQSLIGLEAVVGSQHREGAAATIKKAIEVLERGDSPNNRKQAISTLESAATFL